MSLWFQILVSENIKTLLFTITNKLIFWYNLNSLHHLQNVIWRDVSYILILLLVLKSIPFIIWLNLNYKNQELNIQSAQIRIISYEIYSLSYISRNNKALWDYWISVMISVIISDMNHHSLLDNQRNNYFKHYTVQTHDKHVQRVFFKEI